MFLITKHDSQTKAIRAARKQAVDEARFAEDGQGVAVVLDVSGNTRTYTSRRGQKPKLVVTPGWIKSGHVNVPASIYDAV